MPIQSTKPGHVPGVISIETLQTDFKGELLLPGSPGYDEARKAIWNGMIDRRPAAIARCVNVEDVIKAVNFARNNNLVVSVKGGGHNVAGNAVCEGGLMIDLSPMKAIRIDPESATAKVEPGVIWREFDTATMQFNLATTGGTISDTGIAGLTLGGGVGYLMGKYGATCDNLLSAELVTAKGELLKVDKDNHTDLFWAIRGGGGNFGIVTSFEYQLHPVNPTVMAGMLLYPMDKAKEVFSFFRKYVREAPDDLLSYSGFIVTPDGLPVTVLLPVWVGPIEDADKYLAPLRNFGSPLADMITEMPYTQIQSLLDAAAPAGIRRYWKSGYFTGLTDDLLDICLKHLAKRPSPMSPVLFLHIRGAITKVDPTATAFTLAEEIRDVDPDIPLFFLSAKTMKEDIIQGYKLGADDYITKPFDSEVLLHKIKAILKRNEELNKEAESREFDMASYHFNPKLRELSHDGKTQTLSPKENELLKMLAEHMNDLLPREQALKKIWGSDTYFNGRSMDVYIAKLRKYLKEDPNIEIVNIHGNGFRLVVQ